VDQFQWFHAWSRRSARRFASDCVIWTLREIYGIAASAGGSVESCVFQKFGGLLQRGRKGGLGGGL
jgi:hypothetical protein